LPRTLSGRAADLGAGWGYLSEHILRECPEVRVLDLFEADRRALEAARRTLTPMIGARRVNFRLADVTAGVGAALYNFVVMNPPFHEGRASDPFLGLRFIGAAAAALRPEGELWMVANRNLPYEAPLEELFETVEKLTEEQGFKIFRAAGTKVHRPSSRQRRQP
jgi:16S rRNA (guanine1207-N2)-methyltransferase